MALVCSLPTSTTNPFTFIDCSSINISYDITGMAAVSFTVVSTSRQISTASYSSLTFGNNASTRSAGSFSAGSVRFDGYITSYELSKIQGTEVYEHKLSLVAWGCRV